MGLHQERTHPSFVEGCFACRVGTVAVSADAMPTRKAGVAIGNAEDKQLAKDGAAYRRLRKEGLQPPTFQGAAAIETNARTKDEVEVGRPLPGDGVLRRDLLPQ